MSAVYEILGIHPFFAGMSDEHLRTIASCASPAGFGAGETIFHEGSAADACFLILEGDVALELVPPGRGPHVVQTLHSGEILGWSWLFPPYKWSFDAQALVNTKVVRFDAAGLRAARDADPAFGYELLSRFTEVLVRRMQAARLQLMDVYAAPR